MIKLLGILLTSQLLILGQNNIDLEFDYAQFSYDSTSNYLEIYYSIFPNQFILSKNDSVIYIQGKMNINIQDEVGGLSIIDKSWDVTKTFTDSMDYYYESPLLGNVGFKLIPGKYIINVSVNDMNSEDNKVYREEKIECNLISGKPVYLSEIQFANRIIKENANRNSIFFKNTFEVYPNPSSLFTERNPILYYYCELYNLNLINNEKLKLLKSVYNSKNDKVFESIRSLKKQQESIVEVGIVDLRKLPTDSYQFNLTITDGSEKNIFSREKRFYLVNPKINKEESNLQKKSYLSSEFGVLSSEECDDMFDKSRVLATGDEIDQYESIDSLDTKREFLYNYWLKRDSEPLTAVNEFKINYFSRIDIAFERYSTVSNPGYKTDRGRIYSRLGEPDEIERHPNETDSKPFEIWYYNQIEGGVYFVFGDYTGFNNYELLHSTLRGELQDTQWQRRIRTN